MQKFQAAQFRYVGDGWGCVITNCDMCVLYSHVIMSTCPIQWDYILDLSDIQTLSSSDFAAVRNHPEFNPNTYDLERDQYDLERMYAWLRGVEWCMYDRDLDAALPITKLLIELARMK